MCGLLKVCSHQQQHLGVCVPLKMVCLLGTPPPGHSTAAALMLADGRVKRVGSTEVPTAEAQSSSPTSPHESLGGPRLSLASVSSCVTVRRRWLTSVTPRGSNTAL